MGATVTWTREPVRFILRKIEASPTFPPDVKSHILRWAEDLGVPPDDPARQVVLACAIRTYALSARLSDTAIRNDGESDADDKRDRRIVMLDEKLQKLLRVSRIGHGNGKGKAGGLPTAPSAAKNRANSVNRDIPTDLAADEADAKDEAEAS